MVGWNLRIISYNIIMAFGENKIDPNINNVYMSLLIYPIRLIGEAGFHLFGILPINISLVDNPCSNFSFTGCFWDFMIMTNLNWLLRCKNWLCFLLSMEVLNWIVFDCMLVDKGRIWIKNSIKVSSGLNFFVFLLILSFNSSYLSIFVFWLL